MKAHVSDFAKTLEGYANTKLLLCCWVIEFAQRDEDLVYCTVQPGAVATPMGEAYLGEATKIFVRALKMLFFKSPWQGAQTFLYLAQCPSISESGKAWANNSEWKYWNKQLEDNGLRKKVVDAMLKKIL